MPRRFLWLAAPSLLLAMCLSAAPIEPQGQPASDPLPSWNDGPNKQAIVDFVKATADKASPKFVPEAERIATFDNDGTLWVEQPLYTQLVFALDRVKELAPKHADWKTKEPFKAVLSGNLEALAKLAKKDLLEILAATHAGMSVEEFRAIATNWLATAKHPRFKRLYTECVYQPMLEVMKYLRANGFKTYIVSGGGQDFMRVFSDRVYGIPPEQVIGSAAKLKYGHKDGRPVMLRLPALLLLDDEEGKPEDIELFIGRKPLAAFGNSDGDRQMLEWTQSGGGTRLMVLVHHDDDQREYAYGAKSKIGTFSDALMAEAKKNRWNVISMKNDWKRVFPFEMPGINLPREALSSFSAVERKN
jgi:phosphoglycolate phosphatase-like HAD superfamily hydrolase